MKVLISGYYGFGNIGDDSVLQAIIGGLRGYDPKIKITALSGSPQLTAELEKVEAVHRFAGWRIFAKMLQSDVFISGGGTLLQNVTSTRSFFYYISLIILAKLCLKKTIIFAQGFGPLKGRFIRLLARFVLNRVDLITVRDQDSFEEIRKLGVNKPKLYLSGDPSALLKIPRKEEGKKILSLEAIRTNRPLIGIALRSLPQKQEAQFHKALSEAIDWLSKMYDYSAVFVLFQSPEDMAETSRVMNYMQEKSNVVFRMCRPAEMLAMVSNFDLLIGMRLHSLIFAAMASVPMLGIAYDPKVEAFMKSIKQPYLRVGEEIAFSQMKAALQNIIAHKKEIRLSLDAKAKELHDQAILNFKLFFNYFKPRRKIKK